MFETSLTDNYYLTEQEFFTYIKFFKLYFKAETVFDIYEGSDNSGIRIHNISLGEEEQGTVFNRIENLDYIYLEKKENIQISKLSKEIIDEINKNIEKETDEKQKKEFSKVLKKMINGKNLTLQNVGKISWVFYEIYGKMYIQPIPIFIPKDEEEVSKQYKSDVDFYLDRFVDNELDIKKNGYYKFDVQKQGLINIIKKDDLLNLYGNNFILKREIDDKGKMFGLKDFPIIQTIFGLERLGYLEVVDLWEDREWHMKNKYEIDDNRNLKKYICFNISLNDNFIKEINNEFKKENPKVFLEKYNNKNKVILIAGKKVNLAKKGKDTDDIKLLEILLSDKEKTWYADEIKEKFGYQNNENIAKNKFYYAKNKLNEKVEKEIGIKDFIDGNTTEFKINDKYLRVDE